MPDLSIIIPAYNCSTFIINCIKSIKNQTYSDFEVIIINDGSTDDTQKVIEDNIINDDRFRLLNHKKNGVSCSRNQGISVALGKYIMFIDADDYIENTMTEMLVKNIEQENADIVRCGYISETETGKILFEANLSIGKELFDKQKIRQYALLLLGAENEKDMFKWSRFSNIWNAIFKKEIIISNSIYFKPDLNRREDSLFLYEYLANSERMVVIPDHQYHYVQHKVSNVHTYNNEYYLSSIRFLEYAKRHLDKYYSDTDINKRIYFIKYSILAGNILNIFKINDSFSNKIGLAKRLSENNEFIDLFDYINIRRVAKKHFIKMLLIKNKCIAILYFLYCFNERFFNRI